MSRYQYVIFDLDGTLLNSETGVIKSLQETVSELGLPVIKTEDYSRFIGPPMEKSMSEYFSLDGNKLAVAVAKFREIYQYKFLYEAGVYDGILELLGELLGNGIITGIATNKPQSYAIPLIEHFGLSKYCKPCIGYIPELRIDKAEIIKECISQLQADLNRTVYIGDTSGDMQAASRVGIGFIGVTYGFGFKPEAVVNNTSGSVVALAHNSEQLRNILLNGGEIYD